MHHLVWSDLPRASRLRGPQNQRSRGETPVEKVQSKQHLLVWPVHDSPFAHTAVQIGFSNKELKLWSPSPAKDELNSCFSPHLFVIALTVLRKKEKRRGGDLGRGNTIHVSNNVNLCI